MIHAGDVLAWLARSWGFPRGSGGNVGGVVRNAQMRCSARSVRSRSASRSQAGRVQTPRRLAPPCSRKQSRLLHLARPRNLQLLMTRFLLVNAAPSPPCSPCFSESAPSRRVLGVAASSVVLVVIHDPLRPIEDRQAWPPVQLTQTDAAYLTGEKRVGAAVAAYGERVLPHACVGADRRRRAGLFPPGPGRAQGCLRLSQARFPRRTGISCRTSDQHRRGPVAAGEFRKDADDPLTGGYWLLAAARHAATALVPAKGWYAGSRSSSRGSFRDRFVRAARHLRHGYVCALGRLCLSLLSLVFSALPAARRAVVRARLTTY